MNALCRFSLITICALLTGVASAAYPDKSIHLIVPYAPAGGTDLLGRVIAESLSNELGQPVVVENRPGANGVIGTHSVAMSKPDGYTLLLGGMGPMAVNQAIVKNLSYDALSNFTPVIMISNAALVMAVNPQLPIDNATELVEYSHAHPGKVFAANAGNGSPHHICAGLFANATGADFTSVAYKGAGPAIVDLVAGNVQVLCDNVGTIRSHIESGKVKPIAVTTKERTPLLPDVPTLSEQGVADFDFSLWFSLVAPRGTPTEVLQRLNTAMNKILEQQDVKEKLFRLGSVPMGGSVEEAANYINSEHQRWSTQAKSLGLQQE